MLLSLIFHVQNRNLFSMCRISPWFMLYFSLLNIPHTTPYDSIQPHLWIKKKVDLRGIEPRISEEQAWKLPGGCLHKLGALTIGPQVLCRNSVADDPHYKIHFP